MRRLHILLLMSVISSCSVVSEQESTPPIHWQHLSSESGDIEPPNGGDQQTASLVVDIDMDGVNDFVIAERTSSPSVVWYRRGEDDWQRMIMEQDALRVEAGGAIYDIDQDGDNDIVFGGDSGSNEVWWWENPFPDLDPERPWRRRLVKSEGANKHHDQLFGDFDADGEVELAFWNQGANTLFLAEIPEDPRNAPSWEYEAIYVYSDLEEPSQRGEYPSWKGTNEHEGLAAADLDGDGFIDLIAGGRWFKYLASGAYEVHEIDPHYAFTRAVAGQLVLGGRPEIILVAGDGKAPLLLYQWDGFEWTPQTLIELVTDGHSLSLIDFNNDGNLDIFTAEMRLGSNPEARTRLLLGDGAGNFETHVVTEGFGLHEARIADLDGDKDLDILGKPYTWRAPRLDVWLNQDGQR